MYNVKDIAKYIISYSYEQNKPVSNLKLQKLLYFVQGESYKIQVSQCLKLIWKLGNLDQ